MQFTRSGRIAVTKTEMPISSLLQQIRNEQEAAFAKA
jgi:acetolactate synthase-1/3 small subunit